MNVFFKLSNVFFFHKALTLTPSRILPMVSRFSLLGYSYRVGGRRRRYSLYSLVLYLPMLLAKLYLQMLNQNQTTISPHAIISTNINLEAVRGSERQVGLRNIDVDARGEG